MDSFNYGGVEELLGVDWRQAWRERERVRRLPDNVKVWDERADEFAMNAGASAYAGSFLDYLGLEPGLSVLDMGCGGGTLAIPLARQGHEVLAADFSSGMLNALQCAIQKEGLTGIRCVQLDFNAPWEQWEAAGLSEDCVDVALASRSTMVEDLGAALEKLERTASQRVAVTMATEYSPKGMKHLGERIEGGPPFLPDFFFAVNILLQKGRYPVLKYIDSQKPSKDGTVSLVRWAYVSWDVKDKKEES